MRGARGHGAAGARRASRRVDRRAASPGSAPTTSTSTSCTCPTPTTPIGETLAAFAKLVAAGKVREIGCSNFSARDARRGGRRGRSELGVPRFVNVQNNYSLLDRSRRGRRAPRVRAARRRRSCRTSRWRAACSPASTREARRRPRARGSRRGATVADHAHRRAARRRSSGCAEYASAHGHTLPELALSWLAACPTVGERDRRRDVARAGAGQRGRPPAPGSSRDAERAEVDALADAGG